ncbi:hypothetical protein SALBM135S_06078 [Streptomyces alboniger]
MEFFNALTNGASHGVLHEWNGDAFDHTPWREVVEDAHGMAAGLRTLGVGPGIRVAAVLTNTPDTVRGLLAVWLAGGVVASLPLPTRGQSGEAYGEQLVALAARLDPMLLLVDDRLTAVVPRELAEELPVHGWSTLRGTGARCTPSPPGPDDLAFIQYSSGSTSTPKGCALTTRAIERQLEIILHLTGGLPGADTVASWLPLSHDMGMFGCLLARTRVTGEQHRVLPVPVRARRQREPVGAGGGRRGCPARARQDRQRRRARHHGAEHGPPPRCPHGPDPLPHRPFGEGGVGPQPLVLGQVRARRYQLVVAHGGFLSWSRARMVGNR